VTDLTHTVETLPTLTAPTVTPEPMLFFQSSSPLTMGVELELMIVNVRDFNLTRGSDDLLHLINRKPHGYDIKPEITEGMIEIGSAIHTSTDDLLAELRAIRSLLVAAAERLNLALAGGGAHPFQHWDDQRIYPKERYRLVGELYGYLAKQFTVYGQHVHIGCPNGDWAVRLTHYLSRYIPHFIALSASSPFYQGVDTRFQTSRLTSVNAFPLSGSMPCVNDWEGFNQYFQNMAKLGIVASMKDFYWDIRPKPEYGTVEVRICDTPLSIENAVLLAGYIRLLAKHCFAQPMQPTDAHSYLTYTYNRFQACRFGFEGVLVKPLEGTQTSVLEDILVTLDQLRRVSESVEEDSILAALRERTLARDSDSDWLRQAYARTHSLSDVVRRQAERWMYGRERVIGSRH